MTILLGGYAAKRCPVRVHNDYSPSVPNAPWEPSPEDQVRIDAGVAFEAEVFSQLVAALPGTVPLDPTLRKPEAVAATVQAMDEGAPLILGGWLPDDHVGARTGRPDLLIRADGGYLPGDVKHHTTAKPATKTTVALSEFTAPATIATAAGWTAATSHRVEDGMQLAHYTRLLQACGRHPGPHMLLGAIIGTTPLPTPDGDSLGLVWHDLNTPIVDTFSRTETKRKRKKRSLLERHDHEHTFRVRVAEQALLVTGQPGDPQPLVTPIGHAECDTCPYEDWCATTLGDDDPSFAITIGRLDRREWLTLRTLGVTTTTALADLNPDDPDWFDPYAQEVTHLPETARKRLAGVVERARMIRDGITHYKDIDGPVQVPTATVEVDIDNENDHNGRVYMWGARIRHNSDESTATYRAFTVWEPLTDDTQRQLAQEFVDWLRQLRTDTQNAGGTILVFHWSHAERSGLKRILGEDNVHDLINEETGVFCDVEKVFKSQFTSLRGTSIKKIAPLYGFTWRVDNPGGAISQTYLATQQNSTNPEEVEQARAWLLSYNEDDNAAMAAIRDGMMRYERTCPSDLSWGAR